MSKKSLAPLTLVFGKWGPIRSLEVRPPRPGAFRGNRAILNLASVRTSPQTPERLPAPCAEVCVNLSRR